MTQFANIVKEHYTKGPTEALKEYLIQYTNTPSDKYAHLIGICYAQLRDYDKSIAYFEKIKNVSAATLTAHGTALIHLRKFLHAEKLITQALTLEPNNPHTHNALGNLRLKSKNYAAATHHFHKASILAPKVATYHLNYGISKLGTADFDDALSAFSQATELDETLHQAWQQMGLCHEQKLNHDQAILAYKKALAEFENYEAALHGLGRCYLATNQLDKAIQKLNLAIVQDPTNIDSHHNIATSYYMSGLHNQALKHWHYCQERQPSAEYTYQIAVCYQNTHKYSHAKDYFNMTLKADKQHLNSILNLAAIALEEHQPKVAIKLYKQALKIKPSHTDAKFIIAALSNNNTYDKAPSDYIENLFDQYASSYDQHLTKGLNYQIPEHLNTFLCQFSLKSFKRSLDIGCGTGLLGHIIKPYCTELIGIDLSNKMLEQAEQKSCYDELIHGDFMQHSSVNGTFDLIIALDVLPYFGDCCQLMQKISNHLNVGATCFVSFEIHTGSNFHLHRHVRYCHNIDYIRKISEENGLVVHDVQELNIRKQQAKPVAGAILQLIKSNITTPSRR